MREREKKKRKDLVGGGDVSVSRQVGGGEDEVVLLRGEGVSQNDGVEMRDWTGAGRQGCHGVHVTKQVIGFGHPMIAK